MATLDTSVTRKPPLAADPDGVIRVGGTRVRLETVIGAFLRGATPEEILLKYPALELADIYSVIAYYLQQREAVDAYLEARRRQGEEAEREIEARFPTAEVRERLLARRKVGS